MATKRILLICADVLPLEGFPTTGAGLRSWAIGKGLEACGHDVIFSMPAAYLNKGMDVPKTIADYAWEVLQVQRIIDKVKPEIVIFSHWPSVQIERRLDIPTVLDFHGPHILERAYQNYSTQAANAAEKIRAIQYADFFTCAGDKQKSYFLGWLLAAGVSPDRPIIASIPVSLSPDLPEHNWSKVDPIVVYGGIFLPWQDPVPGLKIVSEVMAERGQGTLKFFGGKHPVYPINGIEYFDNLLAELQRNRHVQLAGLVSHDRLIQEYCQAHVALDLMRHNYERELAFTTRTVEYLWCGLPVIYNDYAELSNYIRDGQAGWVVNPDDPATIRAVIEDILDHPDEVRRRGENAQRLVREHLNWEKTIAPLDAFCRDPWIRETAAKPHLISVSTNGHLPLEDKTLHQLINEAVFHWRIGGPRAVAVNGIGFVKKRVQRWFAAN